MSNRFQILPVVVWALKPVSAQCFLPKDREKRRLVRAQALEAVKGVDGVGPLNVVPRLMERDLWMEPCDEGDAWAVGYALFEVTVRHWTVIGPGLGSREECQKYFDPLSAIAESPTELIEMLAFVKILTGCSPVRRTWSAGDILDILQAHPEKDKIVRKLSQGGARSLAARLRESVEEDPQISAAYKSVVEAELDALAGVERWPKQPSETEALVELLEAANHDDVLEVGGEPLARAVLKARKVLDGGTTRGGQGAGLHQEKRKEANVDWADLTLGPGNSRGDEVKHGR